MAKKSARNQRRPRDDKGKFKKVDNENVVAPEPGLPPAFGNKLTFSVVTLI
jgi:hypothetical protein